ncbi:hypothetical protein BsWGS_08377 [Bradybaena similaris]
MTDTSPYTTEERLIAAVWVHDRVLEKRTMTDLSAKFQERFKKPAPQKEILLAWEKKTIASGSVLDAPRSGRPASRMYHVEIIQQSLSNSPKKSTRKRSAELQILRSTLQKVLKTDIGMSAFRPILLSRYAGCWMRISLATRLDVDHIINGQLADLTSHHATMPCGYDEGRHQKNTLQQRRTT